MTRLVYLFMFGISLLATGIIWSFIAGWSGRFVFFPDLALLNEDEWLSWGSWMVIMYLPIAASIYTAIFAAKAKN